MRAGVAALAAAALSLGVSRARADDGVEVTVQGDPLGAPSERDPTAATTTITRDKLTSPGASAADVLARVPGVEVSRTGATSDLATAQIRGATSAETPVYLAGVRINDDVTGTADLSRVPLWMIDHVEVFRGSAPLDADRLGLGGAIFFEPIAPRDARVGGGAEIGSFGERAAWAGGAAGDARAGGLAAVRVSSATNGYAYLDDRGTRFDPTDDAVRLRQNADARDVDAWAVGRAALGGGATVTTIANAFAREQGVTGLGVVPAREARAELSRFLAGATARAPCRADVDKCRLELVTSAILTGERLTDPLHELGLTSALVSEAGRRVGETARLVARPVSALSISGVVGEEIETLAIDGAATPVRARRATSRAAAQATLDVCAKGGAATCDDVVPRLEIAALGSFSCDATTGPPDPDAPSSPSSGLCGSTEPSARIGARARLARPLDLFVNLGRYARVPTLGELYGTSAAVRGNPSLTPETGLTVDAGARVGAASQRASFHVEAVGFARVASDLVAYEQSDLGVVRPFNVASARLLGAEVTAAARALDLIKLECALTFVDPRDTTDGRTIANDVLPFQARLVAAPALELYRDKLASFLDRASIAARYVYRASRVADPAGLIVLPAESQLDLEVTLFELGRRISERLALTDVLDTQNFDVLGLPLPGRAVHASLEAWWW
ncbi:MAG TPA: TonB-dependent receptor [Byssovorax sp.]